MSELKAGLQGQVQAPASLSVRLQGSSAMAVGVAAAELEPVGVAEVAEAVAAVASGAPTCASWSSSLCERACSHPLLLFFARKHEASAEALELENIWHDPLMSEHVTGCSNKHRWPMNYANVRWGSHVSRSEGGGGVRKRDIHIWVLSSSGLMCGRPDHLAWSQQSFSNRSIRWHGAGSSCPPPPPPPPHLGGLGSSHTSLLRAAVLTKTDETEVSLTGMDLTAWNTSACCFR